MQLNVTISITQGCDQAVTESSDSLHSIGLEPVYAILVFSAFAQ